MSAALLRQALEEIQSSEMDDSAKAAAVEAIYRVARRNAVPSFGRDEQVAFVQQLLAKNVPDNVIAARLVSCFQVGRSTAYDRITKVRESSRNLTKFRTEAALNKGTNSTERGNHV